MVVSDAGGCAVVNVEAQGVVEVSRLNVKYMIAGGMAKMTGMDIGQGPKRRCLAAE